ncbi:MAG: sulfurtransferase-like selenium metabolism protein YedF [Desulfuromonadales bacterium]|nr:sulfurtransferase-like selenium metabolism protein YedF [Desulfuromonadales bacterium]
MITLDLRTVQCPHPVIQSRKALLNEPGCELTVLVGDETARENLCRLANSLSYTTEVSSTDDGFRIVMTPDRAQPNGKSLIIPRRTIVLLAAETMGSGDDELGRLLLKNYLITLIELTDLPEAIFLVNAGVKLVCEGSELLEIFDKIGCLGVDIAACGLCLDFFHLKEKQKAGRTTNMLEIATTLQSADGVIRP